MKPEPALRPATGPVSQLALGSVPQPAAEPQLRAIRLLRLTKSFGSLTVLHEVSYELAAGQVSCFSGPSGSGKTTLLRILLNLEVAESGNVDLGGHRSPSVVFQEDRLCLNLSALANCQLVMSAEVSRITQKQTALAALERAGLADQAQQPVRELSGGQQRRVALVRALVARYDFLVLDEPFKGLDAETKDQVITFVREQTQGKTVVMVTHEVSEAQAMGARIIELA